MGKLLFFVSFFMFIFLFSTGRGDAIGVATSQPSDGGRLIVSAVGTYFSPVSISTLYVPVTNSTGSVTINNIENEINGAPGRISRFSVRQVNPGGNCGSVELVFADRNASVSNTGVPNGYTLNFDNLSTTANVVIGENGANKEYCVYVETDTSLNGPGGCSGSSGCYSMNVVFTLSTSLSQLLGNYNGGSQAQGTGYYQELASAQAGIKWQKEIEFAANCQVGSLGPLTVANLYDLDTYLSVNDGLRIQLSEADRSAGAPWTPVSSFLDGWGDSVTSFSGFNYYPNDVQTGETVRIRPNANFQQDKKYRLLITGIGQRNKIRIRLPFDQISANTPCPPPPQGDPVGRIDSCRLDSNNRTVIYGWAFDVDSASNAEPSVNVVVNGNTQNEPSNVVNYRVSEINSFLNARGYDTSGSGNVYGFTASFSGLYKGSNFPVSGTVNNVPGSPGSNQPMVVNTSTPITTADGFVDGSLNFPGNVLPDDCLSNPPSPSCSIEIDPLEQEVDRVVEVTITALQDTAGDYIVNTVTGTSSPNIGGLSSTGLTDTVGSDMEYTFTISSPTILDYTVSASIDTNFGPATCEDPGGVTDPGGSIVFRPYIQTFRGDVTAGYGMVDALGQCSTDANAQDANAQIRGFVGSQIGAPSAIVGSGGQLMVHALGAVRGFRSAITETGANSQPWVRVFANASRVSTDGLANQNYGGQFDTRFCEEDWFKDRPSSYNGSTGTGTYDLTTFNGTLRYDTASGPVRMTASGQIEDSFKVFVDGDVVIEGASRIEQQQSGWNSVYDIPSVIIVADGNIYIDDSVSVLDATLVSTGTVFTCVNTSGSLPSATNSINDVSPGIYREGGSCNTTPLTLNGAIIADSVRLWRTGGTTTRNNGGLSSGSQSYQEGLTQAETFRLPPELYVVPRFGETPDNQNKFDALLSLPPAF